MPTSKQTDIGDDAVAKATGKNWKQWYSVLDKAGAKKMSHREIVAYVSSVHEVGPWWQQMVTVNYERVRGLRDRHQTATGYSVSGSRVLKVPVATAYRAWVEPGTRKQWLEAGVSVRTKTENKSLRLTWTDGVSLVVVAFYEKEKGKCQVTVEHSKLATAEDAARMKDYWSTTLNSFKQMIET